MDLSINTIVALFAELNPYLISGVIIFITTILWVVTMRNDALRKEKKQHIDALEAERASRLADIKGTHDHALSQTASVVSAKSPTQAECIAQTTISKRKLMNASEFRLFRVLESWTTEQNQGYRLFAQVSLGEVLGTSVTAANKEISKRAFHSFNSKRLDFLFVDRSGLPVLAIEYQGADHYQGNAAYRDAIKRAALQKAGVPLLDIGAQFDPGKIRATLSRELLPQQPPLPMLHSKDAHARPCRNGPS